MIFFSDLIFIHALICILIKKNYRLGLICELRKHLEIYNIVKIGDTKINFLVTLLFYRLKN